jgi:hypothetical protein
MAVDLTTTEGFVGLMETSETAEHWDRNCDEVKRANGGNYPSGWYPAIVQSGLADRVAARWRGDANIRVSFISP